MATKVTKRMDPKRAKSSESRYTIREFDREFSDDAACMDWLVSKLYPDGILCPTCGEITNHYPVSGRTSYACQNCGHHEYPLVGTIFQGSSISLRLWFQAIYLMASTRCGISAKQVERELGVTYPTAWRMCKQIRSLLGQDDFRSYDPATATVVWGETYNVDEIVREVQRIFPVVDREAGRPRLGPPLTGLPSSSTEGGGR